MIIMKINSPFLDNAYDSICSLKWGENFFNVAIIDYVKGAKIDYSKPDTWPLKFLRVKNNKVKFTLNVAVATAGYKGAGPLFTYNALIKFGFSPGEEIFKCRKDHVHLEYYK